MKEEVSIPVFVYGIIGTGEQAEKTVIGRVGVRAKNEDRKGASAVQKR